MAITKDKIDIEEGATPSIFAETTVHNDGSVKQREVINVGSPDAGAGAGPIAEVLIAAPTTEAGLVVRNIPSGTQDVNATQATAASLQAEVQGPDAEDAAITGNPVLVGGTDASLIRVLATDNGGVLAQLSTTSAGDAVSNTLIRRLVTGGGGSGLPITALSGYNGTTFDRLRSSIAQGLEVDVTQSALPTGAATSALQLAADHTVAQGTAAAGGSGWPVIPESAGGNQIAVTAGGEQSFIDGNAIVDNTAFVDGTSPLTPIGYIFDEVAGVALTENDLAAARVNANRAQVVTIEGAVRGTRAAVGANGLEVDVQATVLPPDAATQTTLAAIAGAQLADGHGVVASAGTDLNTSALALDATLTDGSQVVTGAAANAVAVAGNPVRIAGKSGSTTRDIITDSSGNIVVVGTRSPNAGGAGATNHGVLPAISTAAAPSYGEGLMNTVSLDLSGAMRVAVTNGPRTIRHAPINVTTTGDNSIVALVASRLIKVFAINLSSTGTVTTEWRSNTTPLTGGTPFEAREGYTIAVTPPAYLFATVAGQTLNLNLSGTIPVDGFVSYWDDDTVA